MIRRVVTLSLGFLVLSATVAAAQEAELEGVLDRIVTAWAKGDAHALASVSARTGISLDIQGEAVGPLAPRQAAAVLRRFLADRETLVLRQGMAHVVGGAPPRAFGELAWITRAFGTTIPERTIIFVALIWEDDDWRITQIRLLR